jgi:methylglutaconyl-CoA hydratase
MAERGVVVEEEGAIARVRLDRPARRNAFDDGTARDLADAFERLAGRSDLRAVVLEAAGPVFCAGGDLEWMRRAADYGPAENLADAAAFQRAFDGIDRFPRPVVARVQWPALGGGVGLVAVCDVAVAARSATFSLSEARLGLVPGVVAPFVLRKVGPSHARRLFLTAERFDAEEALRIGLVHHVVESSELDAAVERVLDALRAGAPGAHVRAKALVRELLGAGTDEERSRLAREAIAAARASEEGREGTRAFLDKRKAKWAP